MSGERRWGGLRGGARRSGRRTWLRHRLLQAAEIWMFVRFDSTELDFPSSAPRPVFCGMEGRDRCEAQGLGFSVFRDGFEVLPHRTGAGTARGFCIAGVPIDRAESCAPIGCLSSSCLRSTSNYAALTMN